MGGGNSLIALEDFQGQAHARVGWAEPLQRRWLPAADPALARLSIAIVPQRRVGAGSGGTLPDVPQVANPRGINPSASDRVADLIVVLVVGAEPMEAPPGLSTPWRPPRRSGGGAMPSPRGGSAGGVQAAARAVGPGQGPSLQPSSAPAALPILAGGPAIPPGSALSRPVITRNALAEGLNQPTGPVTSTAPGGGADDPGDPPAGGDSPDALTGSSVIVENDWSVPYDPIDGPLDSPMTLFSSFPLYTLDYNNGLVLFDGQYQQATLGGSVDLRAQVRDTTGVTFSWDTSHLSYANSITGANTYRLQFNWNGNNFGASGLVSVTLTATNGGSQQESQTYYFLVPSSNVVTLPSSASWPETLSPETVRPEAPVFSSHGVSVASDSGSLGTTMALPSSNPNIPGLVLVYDSLTADARPMILEHHTIDPAQSVPTKVSAQLTFNGSAGTTYYYDTSQFTGGDIQSIALQADATGLGTGRYGYSVQVVDYRVTNTTTTISGTATVLNNSGSAYGSGWTLQDLEKVTAASGGVILDVGSGGRSLWFTGSFGAGGGTYTNPAGEFSTLVKNGDGTYTRTLTDGTRLTFDSSGNETASIDRNGLRTTYTYSSGVVSKITDPYGKVTTFTYSSGKLSTIVDPAGRRTTFTISGGTLNQVQQADGSRGTYTYDGSGRLTQLKDPNAKAVTIVYDGANRAGTITRPDGTNQTFVAYQERGYDTSGTSGSPAPAVLLAEARASHTDANGHTTDLRVDWGGLGLANQRTDPDGHVSSLDLDSNGLAAVAVDRLNRISQYTYDSLGNVTAQVYPDLNADQYTYNSFSEPLTHTDASNRTTSYTYDGNGNLTGIRDPLSNRTTLSYTANGRLESAKDARSNVTTYQYDSQDRLTTVTYPDGTTRKLAYDTKGNPATVTDERNNATTYAYDALNRTTGKKDPLGNRTTYVYDSAGNLTQEKAPLSRTTTYVYDSMNRLTTVTDPLAHSMVYGYDSAGNLRTVKDALGRVTTLQYDAEDRETVVTDPLGKSTTTTYDAEGQKLTVTDPLNRVTTYSYSNRGWVATVTDPMGFVATYVYSPTGKATASYQYVNGNLVQIGYSYDANDRLTTFTDGLAHTTGYSYDGVGNPIAVKDALSHTTSYSYDSRNRLATLTDALGHTTGYGYDGAGNRQTVTDGLGHTTTTVHDALNRATTITSALGGITTLLYDAAGRQTGLIDPVGNRTTWSYDAADRLTTMTDPLNHSATYVYNNANERTDQTDRNGRRTTYAYDSAGNRTGETWVGASPSQRVTYTYSAARELTGVTDSFATLTITYDLDGRVGTIATSGPGTGQPTVTLSYSYDQAGNRTRLTDSLSSQGVTTYQYDVAFRLTTIAQSNGGTAGPQIVLGYDAANRMTSILRTNAADGVFGKTTATTLVYDNANRLTTMTHEAYTTFGTVTYSALATYVYNYDNANRVTSQQDAEGTANFSYDNTDQLTTVTGSRSEGYTYDLNGNRTMTGYTTDTGNELTNAPGHTYTYDNEGNLATDNNGSTITTYTYDYRNRLTGVKTGGTVVATYTYDALNRRIGIKDNGTQTWTVYDGPSEVAHAYADFNGSGSLTMRYLSSPGVASGALVDQILARTSSGGTTAWYLADRLASVHDVVNTSGTVLDHIVYDSFGNIVSETNAANGDRFKFAWMEYDAAISQYYDRARDYASAIGRFTGQDPKGMGSGDANLYRYVSNGPTLGVDPTGMGKKQITPVPPGPWKPPSIVHPPSPPGASPPRLLVVYDGADLGAGPGADWDERLKKADGTSFQGVAKGFGGADLLNMGGCKDPGALFQAIQQEVKLRHDSYDYISFMDHGSASLGQQFGDVYFAGATIDQTVGYLKGTAKIGFKFYGCKSANSWTTYKFADITGKPVEANLGDAISLTWGLYLWWGGTTITPKP